MVLDIISFLADTSGNNTVHHFFTDIFLCLFRYLFEPDHNCYLPTITLENGPIHLGLIWHNAVDTVPTFSEVSRSYE